MSHFLDRRGKGALDGPSMPESFNQRIFLEAQCGSPLGDCHRLPVKLNPRIVAPVAVLILHSCPAAIFGGVPKFIVASIQREANGTLAHVGEKAFKAVQPLRTDRNSSAPVIRVARMLRIQAPLLHGSPYVVRRSFRATRCMTMSNRSCLVGAVARFDVPGPDMRDRSLPLFSTTNASKHAPCPVMTRLRVPKENEFLHLGSGLNSLAMRHSSHGVNYAGNGLARLWIRAAGGELA